MTLSLENKGFTDEKMRKQYTFILLNSKTSTLLSKIKRGHSMNCVSNLILCPKFSKHWICVRKSVKTAVFTLANLKERRIPWQTEKEI